MILEYVLCFVCMHLICRFLKWFDWVCGQTWVINLQFHSYPACYSCIFVSRNKYILRLFITITICHKWGYNHNITFMRKRMAYSFFISIEILYIFRHTAYMIQTEHLLLQYLRKKIAPHTFTFFLFYPINKISFLTTTFSFFQKLNVIFRCFAFLIVEIFFLYRIKSTYRKNIHAHVNFLHNCANSCSALKIA